MALPLVNSPYQVFRCKKLYKVQITYKSDGDTYFHETYIYAISEEIAEDEAYAAFKSVSSFDAISEIETEEIPLGI